MINKLYVLKNVGIFDNLKIDTNTWNKEFKKNNLIYAENGQGKTTLSVIFESLAKGKPDLLVGRKTLGVTGEQKIELISQAKKIKFENNAWSEQIPDMEIFNVRFVTENLYIGDTINPEHKRNLHQFVLGEKGVKLIHEINELDEKIKKIQNEIKTAERAIESHIKGKISVNDFISLQQVDNLDEQIKQLETTLKNIEQSEDILKHHELIDTEIKLPQISEVRELLSRNYDEISKEAEQLVNEHIKSLNNRIAGNWINQGLNLTKEDKCPFCGCKISGNELVQAYKQYFNQKYDEYKNSLLSEINKINQNLTEANIFKLKNEIASNIREAQYWSEKIGNSINILFNEEIVTVLENLMETLKSLFEAKKSDILSTVHLPIEVVDIFKQATTQIAIYQHSITEHNQKIKDFKQKLRTTDEKEIIEKLDKLYLTKKRYETEIQTICQEYKNNIEVKQIFEQQKIELRRQLDQYTERFKATFAIEVNAILEKFGAGFRICDIDTDYRSGPKFEFKLSINGQPIGLCDTKNRDTVPQFKNTLSEGDKSTLAFAFFIAKLYKSDNLDKKIIIIDDPISSLDIYRLHMTASVLSELAGKVQQMFVLTHNLIFAQKFFDQIQNKHEIVSLEIRNKTFKRFDINKSQLSDYFINYFILDDYINGQSSEKEISVARAIRPLLEAHYRMHYPKHFTSEKWLGDFIRMVREASNDQPYFSLKNDKLPEIEAINEYSKQFHHDKNPMADSVQISPTELKSYAHRALKLCS